MGLCKKSGREQLLIGHEQVTALISEYIIKTDKALVEAMFEACNKLDELTRYTSFDSKFEKDSSKSFLKNFPQYRFNNEHNHNSKGMLTFKRTIDNLRSSSSTNSELNNLSKAHNQNGYERKDEYQMKSRNKHDNNNNKPFNANNKYQNKCNF